MTRKIEATFDGKVFRPQQPIGLRPNTRVKITIEIDTATKDKKVSFLQTARALKLDGPTDWSVNIDEYLYGKEINDER